MLANLNNYGATINKISYLTVIEYTNFNTWNYTKDLNKWKKKINVIDSNVSNYELQQYEFFEYPNLQILHHCLI